MQNIREEVVAQLVATRKWAAGTARLGERAGYHCEYCHLDLLASVEAYKEWQVDHIVPISSGGDPENIDNLAVACRTCNVDFKSRWDPRTVAGPSASRGELVEAVSDYIKKKKAEFMGDLAAVRKILGLPPIS